MADAERNKSEEDENIEEQQDEVLLEEEGVTPTRQQPNR
jgi:hypothetical protein